MERTGLIKLDIKIIKETSLLAFPIIIQGLVYELQSLTDKAFLGHLKTEYVSAIGAAQLPLNATMDGLVALSVAITIIVSHLYGAKKQEQAINYVKSAMLYSGLLGICVCLLWEFFYKNPVYRLCGDFKLFKSSIDADWAKSRSTKL